MKKAKAITTSEMSYEQIRQDNAMTPLERLLLAFQLSDFAIEMHCNRGFVNKESSSIQWIELRKKPS